jgi:hypothetical protein
MGAELHYTGRHLASPHGHNIPDHQAGIAYHITQIQLDQRQSSEDPGNHQSFHRCIETFPSVPRSVT